MANDMLVKLFNIPNDAVCDLERSLRAEGIFLKRAIIVDRERILQFVRENFSDGWAHECESALFKNTCWIAVQEQKVVGFACFEAEQLDFFGPIGVLESMRGKNVGKALLLKCMLSLKERGYAYAIIGWVGPVEFYQKCVGATIIPSTDPEGEAIPRSYHDMIRFEE